MKSIKLGLLMLLTVMIITLFGCNGEVDESDESKESDGSKEANVQEETDDEKEYKSEINIALTAQPPTLDPSVTVSRVALTVAGNIFETLYTLNADYEPVPMLAESVDISEDNKTYTFTLREGVQFHNGKEMTSEDVVASMDRWVETSSRAKSLLANSVFEAIDPYTVAMTVEEATSDVLIILATRAQFPAIMPVEEIETASPEGVDEYIGTGPFKLEEWKQDQYVHLVKNEDYQAVEEEASGLSGKKEALVEDAYYHFVTDHATRIAGIQAGEYDVADDMPLENYDQLNADEDIELHSYDGGAIISFFNTNEGLLADVKLREAIATGLDMEEMLLASYVHPDLYSLNPGYMNPSQTQWASSAGEEIYNSGDVEKAKQLLDEAGYNGEEITILATRDYSEMYTSSIVIQEQLRQMDVNVVIDNYDFATFMERKEDYSNWDIFVTSGGYQLTPPQILAVTPDWSGATDPKIAESLTAIRTADSSEEATEEWDELQGFLYEYLSSTVLGHYKSLIASSDKVEGLTIFEEPIIWNTQVAK